MGRPRFVSCDHLEQLVDEVNLLPNIRTVHPPRLPLPGHVVDGGVRSLDDLRNTRRCTDRKCRRPFRAESRALSAWLRDDDRTSCLCFAWPVSERLSAAPESGSRSAPPAKPAEKRYCRFCRTFCYGQTNRICPSQQLEDDRKRELRSSEGPEENAFPLLLDRTRYQKTNCEPPQPLSQALRPLD